MKRTPLGGTIRNSILYGRRNALNCTARYLLGRRSLSRDGLCMCQSVIFLRLELALEWYAVSGNAVPCCRY